ncbi:hypothetical protein OBE_10786 [human gut metagenome]|uniref:Uncharacterized protein n=1 Tax=human gut metagenome TaxID=408170 RepID=K1SSX1_9ZZZZ
MELPPWQRGSDCRPLQRSQIEESLRILQKLDLDLKGSRLDAPLLMQKAICELSLARSRA